MTSGEEAVRRKQEAKAFELGMPLCPDQYIYNRRELYALWKDYAAKLLQGRLLAYADGDALLELSQAKLAGDRQRMGRIFDATWRGRAPFPEPERPAVTLSDFLAEVVAERASFPERMRPNTTTTLDSGSREYEWPVGDPSQVARKYALDVLQGAIAAGELIERAASRFLTNLENGHERGFFFDPLAARHIVQFAETFCDIKLLPWQISVSCFTMMIGRRLRVCFAAAGRRRKWSVCGMRWRGSMASCERRGASHRKNFDAPPLRGNCRET